MPPRKKKKTRSRKNSAISLTGVAEAILLANVGTRTAFNLNAWDFVSDGWTTNTAGKALGFGELSLHEMIYGNKATPLTIGGVTHTNVASSNLDVIMNNVQNNWVTGAVQAVAIPIGFRVGKRLLRKPLSMVNKGFKMAGIRDMVRA
jgi:hypothetical protein